MRDLNIFFGKPVFVQVERQAAEHYHYGEQYPVFPRHRPKGWTLRSRKYSSRAAEKFGKRCAAVGLRVKSVEAGSGQEAKITNMINQLINTKLENQSDAPSSLLAPSRRASATIAVTLIELLVDIDR